MQRRVQAPICTSLHFHYTLARRRVHSRNKKNTRRWLPEQLRKCIIAFSAVAQAKRAISAAPAAWYNKRIMQIVAGAGETDAETRSAHRQSKFGDIQKTKASRFTAFTFDWRGQCRLCRPPRAVPPLSRLQTRWWRPGLRLLTLTAVNTKPKPIRNQWQQLHLTLTRFGFVYTVLVGILKSKLGVGLRLRPPAANRAGEGKSLNQFCARWGMCSRVSTTRGQIAYAKLSSYRKRGWLDKNTIFQQNDKKKFMSFTSPSV